MKIKILFLFVLSSIIACSSSQEATTQNTAAKQAVNTSTDALISYQNEITSTYLRNHLTPFAADSMMGRETGTEGQKKAARFLAEQYESLGLKPVGDNNSYFQKYDLTAHRTDSVVFTLSTNDENGINQVNHSVNSPETTSNFIRRYGGSSAINAEIVFVGYGLQNQESGINHFQGANIQGKWIMVFGDVPQVIAGDTLYQDQQQFTQSWLRNMLQQQVAGILLITDGSTADFNKQAAANQKGFGELSGMQLAYRSQASNGGPGWGITAISPVQAAELLSGINDATDIDAVKQRLNQNVKSFQAQETAFSFSQQPYVTDVTVQTENVVAFMEGADPQLKDEVVVLSAHYDHVGVGEPDSTGDAIYNGANDDGSGTIGILAAARAFSKAASNGVKPRRSVLFLSVSGEEKGLLGSRYYSDHPIFPMEKTVANLNTDMIGRVDPEHQEEGVTDYVYIIGGDIISSQLSQMLKEGNEMTGNLELDMRYNDLSDPNQFYRRSDHWNFGRFGVPFAFFFNGVHEDYHQPSDEVDKMNFDLLTKTVQSLYGATVIIANAENAPEVDNQEFIEITKGS